MAQNRVEIHIVSYAGYSKIDATDSAARHLIGNLVSQGIPLEDVHFARRPCGPEGKSSILCALKAHAIVDDRQDVLNECHYSGVRCFKSEGKRDKDLSYLVLVEDWIAQEGVETILMTRRAQPLKPNQFLLEWGGYPTGRY